MLGVYDCACRPSVGQSQQVLLTVLTACRQHPHGQTKLDSDCSRSDIDRLLQVDAVLSPVMVVSGCPATNS